MKQRNPSRKIVAIENLLPAVSEKLGIPLRAKELYVVSLWQDVVGEKLGKSSQAVAVSRKKNKHVLHVETSSSIVSSEIMMQKERILKILNKKIAAEKMEIADLHCKIVLSPVRGKQSDLKITPNAEVQEELPQPTNEYLHKIPLNNKEVTSIQKILSQTPEKLNELFNSLVVQDLKLKKWKKESDYPLCKQCNEPVNNTYSLLCPICQAQPK